MKFDADNPFHIIGGISAILFVSLLVRTYLMPFLRWLTQDSSIAAPMATIYEPPVGITPAEAATLIDGGVAPHAILATIVDLAIRGYIKIERSHNIVSDCDIKDFVLTLLKPSPALWNLATFERVLLERLFFFGGVAGFKTNAKTTLSGAGPCIVRDISLIEREIHRSLEAKGLHVRSGDWHYDKPEVSNDGPHSEKHNETLFEKFFGAGLAIMAIYTYEAFKIHGQWVAIFGLVLGLGLMYGFSNRRSTARKFMRKTSPGRLKRAECLSFKDFLERVDGDRLRRMPPKTIEKYLPYAMAFGLEQKWSEGFDELTDLSEYFSF